MTVSDRWLLPDGVEDILPPQALRIEGLRRELQDTWRRWGYQLIIPPLIEYLESLLTGTGTDLALQTFKLTDQLSGRMMGLRADMTPQAARIDARFMQGEGTHRLCYCGHVVHTRPSHVLTGRTPLQAGCELFGSDSLAADHEIMMLMLASLKASGLPRIHLDLAHVAIYRELIAGMDADPETEAAIFDALRRKSIPELDELLHGSDARSAAAMLGELAALNGGVEVLAEARTILKTAGAKVKAALADLEVTADRLQRAHPDVELGFDFCELRGYNYHTGLVFGAYVPGEGQVVAQGGRYDAVGRVFGRARPATGFSTDLRFLAVLAGIGKQPLSDAIWAPAEDDDALRRRVADLRRNEIVVQALPGDPRSPEQAGCGRQLSRGPDGAWIVEPVGRAAP